MEHKTDASGNCTCGYTHPTTSGGFDTSRAVLGDQYVPLAERRSALSPDQVVVEPDPIWS